MTLALTDRVAEHLPREGLLQLAAVLEEFRRRAKAGRRAPRELMIVLELDEQTGVVQALEIRKRYDWVSVDI